MAVFVAPELTDLEFEVIGLIEELRDEVSHRVREPRRWQGGLRRMSRARAVQASNSIEGYNATLDDVLAIQDSDEPMDADEETRFALEGYQEAMTYVLQSARDDGFRVDEGLLKALHFMMLKHSLAFNPGRWRTGPIQVQHSETQEIVYTAPDHELVPELVAQMLDELGAPSVPVLARAALAHLNLVMIHPFRDGNGRMARCLQTLVLAREQPATPVFSSIEEYLGRNTPDYYDVLAEVGQGSWHPERDASPWVRFCLTAHYRQARTLVRRIQAFEQMWSVAERLANERRLPERTIGPIAEAAYGLRIKRKTYLRSVEITSGEEIADLTASRDLRALVTAGLLIPFGDTRARYYLGSESLRSEWDRIRSQWPRGREADDPFRIAAERRQLELDIGS